jgi:hypothetical protein
MNMAKNKTVINIHARNYISAVFEPKLREEGFLCPDDKLLCWYRIRNQEIMDTIIFCSSWSDLPLSMEIRYEASPLFVEPIYIKNVNWNLGVHDRTDCIQSTRLYEGKEIQKVSYSRFSDKVWVYAPSCGTRGLYTLEKIVLPYLSGIKTVYDCYTTHKRVHLHRASAGRYRPFRSASREFIDMALYCNDREVFQQCISRVNDALRMYKDLVYMKPYNHALKKKLEHWEQLGKALSEENHGGYLITLEKHKIDNLTRLEKLLKKGGKAIPPQ